MDEPRACIRVPLPPDCRLMSTGELVEYVWAEARDKIFWLEDQGILGAWRNTLTYDSSELRSRDAGGDEPVGEGEG